MLTKINSYRCFSAKKILQFLANYISYAIWLDKPSFINFSRNRRIMMIVFKCINAFFHHKTARCSIAYLFQSTWNRVCISSLRFCFSWLPEMPGPRWWLYFYLRSAWFDMVPWDFFSMSAWFNMVPWGPALFHTGPPHGLCQVRGGRRINLPAPPKFSRAPPKFCSSENSCSYKIIYGSSETSAPK